MTKRSHHARAVVTGAASGIGQAFAVELGSRRSRVICSDIDLVGAQRTADIVEDHGGRALAVACDVSDLAQVQNLAQAAQDWFGGLPSLVVNNAGIGAGGRLIGSTPIEDWERTLSVNLWGPINGCHVFTPLLRAAGAGGIINVSSAASFGAAPRMAAYNVSKAGVLSLSETLAAELAGTDVAVTVLCPTFVKTNILESGLMTEQSIAAARTLMKFTGMSARRVARTTLNANDRGRLHVMPQLEAKFGWQAKRTAPGTYTKAVGLLGRLGPLRDEAVPADIDAYPPASETPAAAAGNRKGV